MTLDVVSAQSQIISGDYEQQAAFIEEGHRLIEKKIINIDTFITIFKTYQHLNVLHQVSFQKFIIETDEKISEIRNQILITNDLLNSNHLITSEIIKNIRTYDPKEFSALINNQKNIQQEATQHLETLNLQIKTFENYKLLKLFEHKELKLHVANISQSIVRSISIFIEDLSNDQKRILDLSNDFFSNISILKKYDPKDENLVDKERNIQSAISDMNLKIANINFKYLYEVT